MTQKASILKRLHPLSARFKGADLSGQDLTDWVFIGADMRGCDLSGVTGTHVDLRCADLTDANLSGIETKGWDLTGANLSGANLDGTTINAVMHGTILAGASMNGVVWNRGGHAGARGVILPARVDFSQWENGRGFHAGVAKLLEQENPNDREILRVCDFILGQSQRQYYQKNFPCWAGMVAMCREEISQDAIDQIYQTFGKYPKMRLTTMWDVAERNLRK